METNSLQRRQGLEDKVPELQRTIDMVETLQRKKVRLTLSSRAPSQQSSSSSQGREHGAYRPRVPLLTPFPETAQDADQPFDTTFELSDTLYATGEITQVDEVYIWLGVSLPTLWFLSWKGGPLPCI